MKQIPQQIKTDYDVLLKDKVVPENAHVHYRKWLRYYLDFCEKYHLKQLERGNLALFIKKLREKKQTPQRNRQTKPPSNILRTRYNIVPQHQ
jgi:hypothetical protein